MACELSLLNWIHSNFEFAIGTFIIQLIRLPSPGYCCPKYFHQPQQSGNYLRDRVRRYQSFIQLQSFIRQDITIPIYSNQNLGLGRIFLIIFPGAVKLNWLSYSVLPIWWNLVLLD